MDEEKLLDGARIAAELRAKTYCIVISGRSPSDRELETIAATVPRIKAKYGLAICASVGLLSSEQAALLKAGGVDRVNHNLNTSRRFYPRICSTHTYQERLDTLKTVRRAGLEICSGGIVGMGEEDVDVVELALELGRLKVEAVPINFLQPIAGTPLAGTWRLNPAILPESAGLVPAGQSQVRVAHCGRAGNAPWAAAGRWDFTRPIRFSWAITLRPRGKRRRRI